MSEYEYRFTIIMVALNAGCHVGSALKSLCEQTFKNYELIFIDGDSEDNTLSIVSDSNINNIKIISEPDAGIYDAMNKGIRNATGEYLYFLNSDDILAARNVLELIDCKLCKYDEPHILYGDIIKVGGGKERRVKFPKVLNKKFFVRKTVCHQAIFARQEIFHHYGLFNLKYPLCADYVWLGNAILNYCVTYKYCDLVVCRYFAYGRSVEATIKENYQAAREFFSLYEILRYRYARWWFKRFKRLAKRFI